jgi:pilus assembly protein CpaC
MPDPERHRRRRGLLGLVVIAALLGITGLEAGAADPGLVRLEVTIGKSQILELKEPFTRVSVTNPAIADVFVITPNQILINGKAVGVTSLVVFYPQKTLFFDLLVQTDTALLRERLKQIAPRDEIEVHPTQDALVLSGRVSSEGTIAAASEVASVFTPKGGKVVNLLSLTDVKPQQVLLQVHVGEVARAALRELGFSFRALGKALQGGAFPGNPFFPPIGQLGGALLQNTQLGAATGIQVPSPDLDFSGSSFFLSSSARDYAGLVRALADRNLFRTLAKPNLVTQSGREAKFISGGEFPYPVAQEAGTISIQFREFGVGLVFTPTVLDGEMINLKVRPEVSSLDFSGGLQSAGFRIPVIRKNQTATTINLKDGESFAIAGMINNEVRQAVAKIPVLGDIPILGALFRSTRFQSNETELLFLVTVKLVKSLPPGSAEVPDATKLMELRESEKKEFTLVPGIPGVGEVMDRPFGQSNLPAK